MGSLITYSAIAAKLAAMRGHFLTDDEFSVLAGMENVPAAVEYLKSSPAYRDVFSGVENEELHRSKIEELLWHSLYGDFSRLFRFANGTQRKFLDLYFLHFEIDVMKRCLRDAVSGKRSDLNFKSFEPFFRKHSHLDFTALTDSKDLDEYLDSIQSTPYYGPLKDLKDQGITSLSEFESALDILYFIRFWKSLKDQLSKDDREAIADCAGEKIDLLNIEWLARAKRHYKLSADAIMAPFKKVSGKRACRSAVYRGIRPDPKGDPLRKPDLSGIRRTAGESGTAFPVPGASGCCIQQIRTE